MIDKMQENRKNAYRREGFQDSRDGVYRPENYAKGQARDAYREGKEQWVGLMAQER